MMDDETLPLLDAWEAFAALCPPGHDPRLMTDRMLSFFAGAGAVVSLIRSAAEQGGDDEASLALAALSKETDAFAVMLSTARPNGAWSEGETQ